MHKEHGLSRIVVCANFIPMYGAFETCPMREEAWTTLGGMNLVSEFQNPKKNGEVTFAKGRGPQQGEHLSHCTIHVPYKEGPCHSWSDRSRHDNEGLYHAFHIFIAYQDISCHRKEQVNNVFVLKKIKEQSKFKELKSSQTCSNSVASPHYNNWSI